MKNSSTRTRITARRVVIPATIFAGISAGTAFGLTWEAPEPDTADSDISAQAAEPSVDSQPAEATVPSQSAEPATAGSTTQAPESTVTADATPAPETTSTTEAETDSEAVVSPVGYTLADAAQIGDPRVGDVECAYLSREDDDPQTAVANFRADRDRFFDIDSALVQAARLDGLTFAEIAFDYGFSEADVQDGAAAMHGYCYEQLIGAGLTQAQAEARFDTTMTRFLTLMDAEPDENGRGAGVDAEG